MRTNLLFTQLLNIELPFSVSSVVYKDEECESSNKKSVHIHISVDTGMECRLSESIINDYEERSWRHLNLFQYPCYIHRRVPKYQNKISKKVKKLEAPWAKSGLCFTLLFEEFTIELVKIHGCIAEVTR